MTATGRRAGFTLMEVVVAMSVLTIAIAGAAFMLTSAYGAYRHQNRTMDVDRLVHNQTETFTATGYGKWREKIVGGRRHDAPPKEPPPPGQDYIYWGGGEASASWDLAPPQEGEPDWKPVPIPVSPDGQPMQVSRGHMRATVRLQFWDPNFDSAAPNDRGLIRASYTLKGDGVDEQAVKYLAREQWGEVAPD